MKTNLFRKSLCVCLLLSSLVSFNFAGDKENLPIFCYNNLGAKELAESQVVSIFDESGKYIIPRLKYLFIYDNNNRVVKKETLRWNVVENVWINSYCLTFTFDDDSMITEYTKWNKNNMNYDECTEKIVYKSNANMFASCSYYKRNSPVSDWRLESNFLVSVPIETIWNNEGFLFAEKNK